MRLKEKRMAHLLSCIPTSYNTRNIIKKLSDLLKQAFFSYFLQLKNAKFQEQFLSRSSINNVQKCVSMYSKVFIRNQKVQERRIIPFRWYVMKQQLLKIDKLHDLSNFALISRFFHKIRIVVVRFLKKKLFTE